MKNTTAIVSGLVFLVLAVPALAQAEDAEQAEEAQRRQALEEQTDRAIRELFQDLQLQAEDDEDVDDPRQRLLEDRAQLEEIQQRIIELQLDEPLGVVQRQQRQAAEPVQLDAKAYVNPFTDRDRQDVVAALDHKKFSVRESAQAALLTDNTLGKAALKELIEQADSPEQHQRLLRIAEHHILRELRVRDFGPHNLPAEDGGVIPGRRVARPASVGYSYEPVMAHENPHAQLAGVRVIATMPGFPGHAHLRPGDIIVQLAGQGLSPNHQHHDITNWVRWRISAHQAGDTMAITLLRDGEPLTIELVCAEGLALDHMYTTDAFETAARKEPYQRAWREARDELTAKLPKPKTLTPVALDAGK